MTNSLPTHRSRRAAFAVALLAGAALLGAAAALTPAQSVPQAPAGAIAGGGCGHDQQLDDARNSLLKAFELIKTSQNPNSERPFNGHDQLALQHIHEAQHELTNAIEFSERSCH